MRIKKKYVISAVLLAACIIASVAFSLYVSTNVPSKYSGYSEDQYVVATPQGYSIGSNLNIGDGDIVPIPPRPLKQIEFSIFFFTDGVIKRGDITSTDKTCVLLKNVWQLQFVRIQGYTDFQAITLYNHTAYVLTVLYIVLLAGSAITITVMFCVPLYKKRRQRYEDMLREQIRASMSQTSHNE